MAEATTSADGLPLGFYSESTGWGGSELYLQQVLQEAGRRGERCCLFCPGRYRLLEKGGLPRGCETVLLSKADAATGSPRPDAPAGAAGGELRGLSRRAVPASLRLAAGTAQEIRRLKAAFGRRPVALLHVNDTGCEPGAVAARLAGVPVVVGALHALPGETAKESDLGHRAVEHVSMRCMDAAIAVSEFTKRAWVERVRLDPRRIRVIHNGIDIEAFRPGRSPEDVRREIGLPPDAAVVGVTARLHPMKGHRHLLEAMPALLRTVPNAHLVLAGDGPLRGELGSLAGRLGVAGRVHFLGHRTDVADVTQTYDVAVLPSVSLETLGYVLMEAMALRKPVVASRFSGIPEVVQDGVTGTLVPRGDAPALAAAIGDLLTDAGKARGFGRAGWRRVRERFSLEKMLRETFALYGELLQARRRQGGRVRP